MKLPADADRLVDFTRDLIDECLTSRENRRNQSRRWRQLFYTGSTNDIPSKYNRCYSHVDKLSSYLFSPADVRFNVEFEGDGLPAWDAKAVAASRYINKRFNRAGCGAAFSMANEIALVEGAAIAKITWGPRGYEPWVIRPSFFGVLREDIEDLNRQEAFTHSFFVTPAVFRRMIFNHPDKDELIRKASGSATFRDATQIDDSYFHEIVTGGMSPIAIQGQAGANRTYGAVGIIAPQAPMLSPQVAANLIRIDDLWVWDDDRADWTTIRYVAPGMIVEGKYKRRNLSDIPGEHPFVKVCSNEIHGYFWGRSELATVFEPQMQINRRVNDIDAIFNLRAKPPRAFSGFQTITEEKARAMLMPGGSITEQAIGAKVDSLAPDMPPEALEYLGKLEDIFDDVGGFTNILSGEGEPGVRAGVHAGVLLRTSTPRLRDRALLVESQVAAFGDKCLKMSQAKDAHVIVARDQSEFFLRLLPDDATVTVDSHSSSPAFVEDNRQTAFALAKAEAIDGETLIEMLAPPRTDVLIDRLRKRNEAQAAYLQAHPEAAEDGKKK